MSKINGFIKNSDIINSKTVYPVLKIISAVFLFVSSYIIVCYYSQGYRYYVKKLLHLDSKKIPFMFAALIFVLSLICYTVSLSKTDSKKRINLIKKLLSLDYLVLILILFTVFFFHYILLLTTIHQLTIIIIPLSAFTTALIFYSATFYHVKDHTFSQAFYWITFYKYFPPTKPLGIIMTILASFTLALMSFLLTSGISSSFISFLVFICAMTSLILLTYLCRFIVSLSKASDKALQEKIKAEEFKTELISNVSHDIRTPLTSIINYSDLIKRLDIQDETLQKYVGILNKKSQRLKSLIDDLMEATKARTGNVKVNFEKIDLIELAGQSAGEYDDFFKASKIDFILNAPPEKAIISADGKLLNRVMENLLSNALKYSMHNSRIYADIINENEHVIFRLRNISKSPLNISPDELMQQFVRGDKARHSEGSGLGLYITQNLIELMNGQFEINIAGDLFETIITFDSII